MTTPVNNYSYSGISNSDLPSAVKKIQENPENFKLYMAQFTNNYIKTLNSFSMPGENTGEDSSNNDIFGSLGLANSTDGLSGLSSDPLSSLFSTTGTSTSDYSSLLGIPTLDSYQVSETISALKDYSDITETKKWLGQTVAYTDPTDQVVKNGVVSKVIIENVEKPIFIVDGKELVLDDLVSIDINDQQV